MRFVVVSPFLSFKLPNCTKCKHSFIKKNQQFCKLYKYTFVNEDKLLHNDNFYEFNLKTEICRNNKELCGPNADFYEEK